MTLATQEQQQRPLQVRANKSTVYVGLYGVPLSDVRSPMELVNWIKHLSRNSHMTPAATVQFIDAVCEAKGWKVDI